MHSRFTCKWRISSFVFTLLLAAIVRHNRNIYIYIYIHSPLSVLNRKQTEIDSIATSKPHFYWQSRMIWPHFVHFTTDATNLFATAWEITSAGNVFVSTDCNVNIIIKFRFRGTWTGYDFMVVLRVYLRDEH